MLLFLPVCVSCQAAAPAAATVFPLCGRSQTTSHQSSEEDFSICLSAAGTELQVAVPQEADKTWRGANSMQVRVSSSHCQLRRARRICASAPCVLSLADGHVIPHCLAEGLAAGLSWSHLRFYDPSSCPHLTSHTSLSPDLPFAAFVPP